MSAEHAKTETGLAPRQDSEKAPDRGLAMPPALAARLRELTPARVALRQTGVSLATGELLDFQLAHARARDAVHAALQPAGLLAELRTLRFSAALPESEPVLLHSAAKDRQTYVQRPDFGRKLDQASRRRLEAARNPGRAFDIAIVLADGLSSLALERHAVPLLAELLPLLADATPEARLAPVCIVEQARVAIGDEIAETLHATLAVVLIGERPGLTSPDSLGAYITWQPRPRRTTDAERNCVSNIRAEGLSYEQAAARVVHYIREARSKQTSGVALKDPNPAAQIHSLQTGSEANSAGGSGA